MVAISEEVFRAGNEFEQIAGNEDRVYEVLELPNWAPWLRFSPEQLIAHSEVFPDGQLMRLDPEHRPVAALSTSKINWDGKAENLPTWDEVAQPDGTFEGAFNPTGDTLVLMSMSVRTDVQGSGIAEELLKKITEVAQKEGVKHIIGDFRPNGYGEFKATNAYVDLATYYATRRVDGLPIDGWLRTLERNGVTLLRIDPKAMVVPADLAEFETYQHQHSPTSWFRVKDKSLIDMKLREHSPQEELGDVEEVWECGETGTWYVNRSSGKAVYIESNVWGNLPLVQV